VAPPRLAAWASHAARAEDLLDITPALQFKLWGPICLCAAHRCAGSTRLHGCRR